MLTQSQKFEERIKMLEIKAIITEMKNASDYLISRQDMAKKESMSVNIGQQKLPRLKCKEGKKEWEKVEHRTEHLRTEG